MGRYTGPVCKQCRREGMKLFLKGARCYMMKCAIDKGRPAPGFRGGMRRPRKASDYGVQLREKQRLRRQFGMQEGQFKRFFEEAFRQKGVTGETLLQLLERRLDNVVFRMGFASSRRAARQFVRHNHIRLNGHKANVPSMFVSAGDVIDVRDRPRSRDMAVRSVESAGPQQTPGWIRVDPKQLRGEFVHVPSKEEIAPIVDEQLIVELYSR